jgi:MFS family permease
MQIGLAFLPAALAIGGLSVEVAARMITRFGGRSVLVMGLTLLHAGLVLFTRAPVDAQYLVDVLPVITLTGIGLGLSFPALLTLAMADATPRDAGLASGLVSTSGQVGGALGLAVLATLATAQTDLLLGKGETVASALTGGYQLGFGVSAGLVLVATILAAAVLRPGAAGQHEPEIAPDRQAVDVAS